MKRTLASTCLALIFQAVALAQPASSTFLIASPSPSNYGQPITLTATVTAGATGKVTFYDGVTILGIGTISGGQASISTVMLPSGNRKLRAYYQGDGTYTASSSAIVPQTVAPGISPGLQPAVTYPTIYPGVAIALGDLNGDSKLDAVIVNKVINSVTVYLGNGDGTFQTGTPYAVGSLPVAVAVAIADFNQDGKPDLAVANGSDVSILLGNGDGTFQPPGNPILGYFSTGIAAADFNNDGKPDLAVLSSSGASILLGNGDGTFQGAVFISGYASTAIAVSDSNGDGIPDLIVTESPIQQLGYVTSLLGNGDGTFEQGQQRSLQYGIQSTAVADLNGDGISDVVVNPNCCYGAILLGNPDGTFQSRSSNVLSLGGRAMGVVDLNGDGLPDVVVASAGTSTGLVGVFLASAPASFQSSISYQPSLPSDVMAIGDFNGDGKPDLILASSTATGYSVLLGGAAPDLTLAVDRESGFTQGQQAAEYFLNVANSGQAATLGTVTITLSLDSKLSAASLTGAGWTCTLATLTCTRTDALAVGSGYPTILLTMNVANGAAGSVTNTFTISGGGETNLANDVVVDTAFLRLPTTTTVATSSNPSTLGQPVTFTATVSSGATGHVVFYSGTTQLGSALLAGGKSSLTTTLLLSGAQKLYAYYTGDSNFGPSTGSLTQTVAAVPLNGLSSTTVASLPGSAEFLLSGDLNGDGKADLVAGYFNGNTSTGIVELLGNGDGTFRPPGASIAVGSVSSAVLGDFNNDGKLDLAILTASGILLLPGNGDGSFSAAQRIPSTNPGNYLFAADFNRDGNLDLMVATQNYTTVVYLGNGAGGFQPPLTVVSVDNYVQVAVADMNGDGIPDFIAAGFISNQQVISIFLGNGDGTFQAPANTFTTVSVGYLVVADFNGDGKLDIAADYNSLNVFLGNGDGTLAPPILSNQGTAGSMIAGDFTGDGKSDIYTFSSLMFGNGDGTFQNGVPLSNVPGGPIVQGDFNGDGKPDFAVAATTLATIEVFLGGQFSGLSVSSAHFGAFTSGSTGNYQITVGNPLLAATKCCTNVSLSDSLPAGLTATSIAGSYWNCTISPLQCTRTDSLASGASYGPISLEVAVAPGLGPAVLNNRASVTVNGLTNSATDATTILPPTLVMLQASANPASLGQPVTLTATVTAGATGTVLFSDGGISLGSAQVMNGQASFTTRQLSAGLRYLVATYSGDTSHGPGSSAETYETIQASPTTGFSNAVTYAIGTSSGAIAAGDVDNDGVTDLVAISPGANTVSVLLGRGDGTFRTHTDYPAGSNPLAVVVADFNNDGQLDIAVGNNDSGHVNVLLGNGDGTFQTPVGSSTAGAPTYLVAADFNGDGKTDLATLSYGEIQLLLGKGDGTFQPGFAGISTPVEAVGDFNRDGKLDLATAFSILLGKGDGFFQVDTLGSPLQTNLAAGDLNGDGIPDLVLSNISNSAAVALGNGDGTFKPPAPYGAAGTGVSSVTLADINGDGKLDVVGLGGSNLGYSIYLGNGDGTLQSPVSYPLSYSPQSLVAGDFNGDGRTDLAFAGGGNGITVLLGILTPVFSIASTHTDPFYLGQTGATYTIIVKNNGPGTTSGQVTVTDTLPAGLTAMAISGNNWNCVLSTLTCTRSDSVDVGASYSPITVTVNVTAATTGAAPNQVSFSGGGAVPAGASDPTTIVGPPITIDTVPSGLHFSVDGGASQTAPQTIYPTSGAHTIAVSATQPGTAGTQYVFTGWSDSGSASHTIAVGTGSATYTATFQTQYQLTVAPYPQTGGSVTPASASYYDSGAIVTLSAVANSPLTFTGWSLGGNANPLLLTLNAPVSVTAVFDVPGATCTMTGDAVASVADVQFIVKEALGTVNANNDLNGDGVVNIADIQNVANAAMQLGCMH